MEHTITRIDSSLVRPLETVNSAPVASETLITPPRAQRRSADTASRLTIVGVGTGQAYIHVPFIQQAPSAIDSLSSKRFRTVSRQGV